MASRYVSWLKNSRSTGLIYGFLIPAAFLFFLALLVGTIVIGKDHTEKSLKRGMEAIRGSRYPKVIFENLQPVLSPRPSLQPSPQSQPAPQKQQQPFPQPQLQPQPQPSPQHQLEPDPQAQPQPSLEMQMQPHPSPRHQLEPQPSPLLEQQQQMQQDPSPPLQPQPQMEQESSLPPLQPQPQIQQESSLPPLQPQPQIQQESSLPPLQLHPDEQMQQELSPPLQPHPEDQIDLSQSQCRPPGSEALPKGLVSSTADLQMQPLWGRRKKINSTTSLFTAAVGIKQKETIDKMVRKFLSYNFNVMLFHYDGIVDAWKDLDWASDVVHVSAINQTKWWFAKRFLHPDIVAEYSHIFLWDEDLGVDNFDPNRYLSIVIEEGLEISQPALDVKKSEVHHAITARWKNATVHRRAKPGSNSKGCNSKSLNPPCTGWVELMAPVFSRTAWRCIWYMIQRDLNHAWGLDILFGYCAQGDRTKNVGVVDAEYVVHYAFPTFGQNTGNEDPSESSPRTEVRRHSFREYKIFKKRWQMAAKEDASWVDPYPGSLNISMM